MVTTADLVRAIDAGTRAPRGSVPVTPREARDLRRRGVNRGFYVPEGQGVNVGTRKSGGGSRKNKKNNISSNYVLPEVSIPKNINSAIEQKRNQAFKFLKSKTLKAYSNIVPREVRQDFERRQAELESIRERQKRYLEKRNKIKNLTPAELKKLSPLNQILAKNKIAQKRNQVKGDISTREKLKLLSGSYTIDTALAGLIATADLPKTINYLARNPGEIKKIPGILAKSAKDFSKVAQISPQTAVGRIAGELVLFDASDAAISKLSRAGTKALGKTVFREIKETPLGIKYIKKVPGVGKIEVIPKGKNPRINVNIERAIPEARIKKQLRPTPKLPRSPRIEKKILDIVKKKGDVVGGSYAQEALLKSKFARKHKDIDILSTNRKALIKSIKSKLGNQVKIKKKFKSIQVFYKGKQVADIVEYGIGEGGYAKKFGFVKHKGLKIARPEGRLGGKVLQLGMGKKTRKVLKDIEDIYGRKVNLDTPSIKGAYGYSRKKQKKIIGKRGTLTTAQADLPLGKRKLYVITKGKFPLEIPKKLIRDSPELKLKKYLYATPFNSKTGRAQLRISRLGISQDTKITLRDLLKGNVTFKKPRPEIFVLRNEKIFRKSKGIRSKNIFAKTPKGFEVPGFSSELEVILGKGYAIKRGKVLTRVNIDGKLVPIVDLKKVKISSKLKSLVKERKGILEKLSKKKISGRQKNKILRKLERNNAKLKTKLGSELNYKYSKNLKRPKYINLKKKALSLAPSILKRIKTRRPKMSRTKRSNRIIKSPTRSIRPSPRRGISPGRSVPQTSRSPSRSPGRYSRSPPRQKSPSRYFPRGSRTTKSKKTEIIGKSSKRRKKIVSQNQIGYNVFGKSGGRFIKLNRLPLTRSDALSRGAYAVDNSTARTTKISPAIRTKKLGSIKQKEKGYYPRVTKKFRGYRIKNRIRKGLVRTVIEKRKFAIDTKGEKKQLSLARLIKREGYKSQARKPRKRKMPKRKTNRVRRRSSGGIFGSTRGGIFG